MNTIPFLFLWFKGRCLKQISIPSSNVNTINMRDFDMPFFSTQSRCKKAELVLFILEKLRFYYCLFGSKLFPPVCCCVLLVSQTKFLLIDFFWFKNFSFLLLKKKYLKWTSIEKSRFFHWTHISLKIFVIKIWKLRYITFKYTFWKKFI